MDEVRLGKKITTHLQISLGNLCTASGLGLSTSFGLYNWWKLLSLRDRDLYDSSDASHEIQVSLKQKLMFSLSDLRLGGEITN